MNKPEFKLVYTVLAPGDKVPEMQDFHNFETTLTGSISDDGSDVTFNLEIADLDTGELQRFAVPTGTSASRLLWKFLNAVPLLLTPGKGPDGAYLVSTPEGAN